MMTGMSCSTSRKERPSDSRTCWIRSMKRAFSARLIPAMGSSRKIMRASCISARANSTCFCVP